MAYGRKRRRTFKRRPFNRRKRRFMYRRPTIMSVKRMISRTQESKWITGSGLSQIDNSSILSDNVTTPGPPAGVLVLINGMGNGTARSARIANRITPVSYYANFAVSTNAQVEYRVRIILFIDKDPDNALPPNFQDIFTNSSPAQIHFSAYNQNNVPSRYKIIKDMIKVGHQYTGISNSSDLLFKIRVRFARRNSIYGDTNSGNVTDIEKNAIWLLMATDLEHGGGIYVNVGWQSTFKFKDA